MTAAAAGLICLLIGFVIGFFSFKVKTRWCRLHGEVKVCPLCVQVVTPAVTPAERPC